MNQPGPIGSNIRLTTKSSYFQEFFMSLKMLIVPIACIIILAGADTVRSQSTEEPEAQSRTIFNQSDSPAKESKAIPEDLESLQALAVKSYEDGDYMRFVQTTIKLRKLRPQEPLYMVGMVVGGALIGRQNTAYNYMHIMQQQGLSYDFNSTEDTKSIRATEVYEYLNDLLIKAGEPMGTGTVAFGLSEARTHPETITWDESRESFLVGTIETGAILSVSPTGETRELIRSNDENGLLAIIGLAVDVSKGRLWVSTAGVPGFAQILPTDLGRGALFEFDLDSLEILNRYYIPIDGLPHVPGAIATTPNGDVYLVDRAYPMVFRKLAEEKQLQPFLANLAAADQLSYRSFLTVCLVIDEADLFPDNWIYIHDPNVLVGRIQNYKNWSSDMVPDPTRSGLGLEYFCNEDDELWMTADEELIERATKELELLDMASASKVESGCVFRMAKAYPVYDSRYAEHLDRIRSYLAGFENLQTIGRNGLHRYDNQDHAMMTGLLAARNIALGEHNDVWAVNTDAEYHEEVLDGPLVGEEMEPVKQ